MDMGIFIFIFEEDYFFLAVVESCYFKLMQIKLNDYC